MQPPLRLVVCLASTGIMTPQWRGLVNGTIIYIVLGVIAFFLKMMVSKPNQP